MNSDDEKLTAAEEAGSQPLRGLARLRDVEPPPSLVAGVMRRIGEPRPFSLWRWLRRPVIQVRLSPLSAGAGALGMAVAAVLLFQTIGPGPAHPPSPSASAFAWTATVAAPTAA